MSRQASDDLDRHGPGYALVFACRVCRRSRWDTNLARQRVDDPSVRIRQWKYRIDSTKPLVDVDAEFLEISSDEIVQLQKLDGTNCRLPGSNLSEAIRRLSRKSGPTRRSPSWWPSCRTWPIVVGIIAIGYWHFNNVKMGIGAATLYLMLPYTSQMTGRVDHALAGGPAGVGRALLSATVAVRHLHGPGDRRHLLSAVSAAALVQFLLAARAVAIR